VKGRPDRSEADPLIDGFAVAKVNGVPDLDDQQPGKLADPNTISIDTVNGNHVVLDIGGGYFAFYAHLQKNSVTVHVGDQVKKGAVLGKLGNSGNTSGPHLHFHIMTGPSVLGSNGVPYVIDTFNLAGQLDIAAFDAAPDLTGNWGKGLLSNPERREREFPLHLNIIDFPPAQNSK
jgi:murein DD-endopeptidase MepM/ murein hydrolase activator NlpD